MSQNKNESLLMKLKKVVPNYIARFIIWHYTPENERVRFDDFMTYEPNVVNKTQKECEEWLIREDAQKALLIYHKHMKTFNLMRIYNTMLEKALTGDINAAKYVEQFSNSPLFDESSDEIDNFLDGINIPALKGGGRNGNK